MPKKEAKKLAELFHDTLKDIYFAEKKILATLPKMEKAAHSPQLKRAFAKHKTETEGHVMRLEKVFTAIDTAGLRKTKSLAGDVEYYSHHRTLRSVRRADIASIDGVLSARYLPRAVD